jgi:predicted metal-dependent peptidase
MAPVAPAPQFTPEQLISASLMRLGTTDRNPFFAALALMAPIVITESIDTAATDGERLYFNPKFLHSLKPAERDGVIVHEVLHAALMHVTRRDSRQPLLWNIACDIVVNGMVVSDDRLKLPEGVVLDPKLEHLTVEEVYELVIRQPRALQKHLAMQDLRPDLGEPTSGESEPSTGDRGQPMSAERRRRIEERWNEVIAQAAAVAMRQGSLPAAMQRHFGSLLDPKVDWRTRLWQYLVRTPDDFAGFDRRLVWSGLYLEQLEGESVCVDVCVDTSGSIEQTQLGEFLAEVKGIMNAYEHIQARLFYADSNCHGPYPLSKADRGMPKAIGGGGTNFAPFFEAVNAHPPARPDTARLLVYLTDGFGNFPQTPPEHPCLWVVVPGGLPDPDFPFGEVVRMVP